MMWIIIVLLLLVVFTSVAILRKRVSKRGNELQQLLSQGRVVAGTVTGVRKQRRAKSLYNYFMSYSYKPFDGEEHSKEVSVKPSEFAGYIEGQEIEIVYLPKTPEIHAFKALIDQVRSAKR